jgi:hypothetical protein
LLSLITLGTNLLDPLRLHIPALWGVGWTHHDKPWPYAVTLELIKPGTATQNVTPEEHRLMTRKAQLSKRA